MLTGPARAEAVAALANMTMSVLGGSSERRAQDYGSHRERTAVIYPRQSTMAQLRQHTESTRSQYALADKAAALGWPRTSIEVIDADLGVSGKWGVPREGFTELVTRVCSGDVGAIFGIEITRLARSNADVARLAEFARITGTLLIDADGVYDPADVNDRVLLGLKSTKSPRLCRGRHNLGYTFRGRLAKGRRGYFTGFGPAISATAKKAKGKQIRNWHLNRRSSADLSSLAREINPRVQGWINYYGAFYRSEFCVSWHGASTSTWSGGPCGSGDSAASTPKRWPGCRRCISTSPACSPTGSSSRSPKAGLWGPDDGRPSERRDKPAWRWGWKSPTSKELATRDGPESCAGAREGGGEALTGVRAGRVIEPRNPLDRGADAVDRSGRPHRQAALSRAAGGPRAVEDPVHVRNLHAREPGGPVPARPGDHRAGRSGNAEAVRLR